MKIGAAYIRVSTERQDEYSPESQLKLIRAEADRRDILVPDEYVFYDDGISGRKAEKRPEFIRMIGLAKSKDRPFDIIFVWKFSRFARNQEESIVYKSLLKRNNVDVVSISEPMIDGPFGTLIERIIEWMDEYYSIRLSGEVKRGLTERALRGLPNVSPPIGYRIQNGEYIVHPEEAEVVKRIFAEYIAGKKVFRIVQDLRSEGFVRANGNPIDYRGAYYILNNPVYTGKTRWSQDGRKASQRIYNDPAEIIAQGKHEPIIDDDTWEKTQAELASRKVINQRYAHGWVNHENMLRGVLKCSNCGATLVLHNSDKGFNCQNYCRGRCAVSHYISIKKITDMVLKQLAEDADEMRSKAKIKPSEGQKKETVNYDKLISREKTKLQRAKEAYQAGIDSITEYRSTRQAVEGKIEEYKRKRAEQGATSEDHQRRRAKAISEALKILKSPDTDEALKNEVMKSIVKKIVFYRPTEKIEIFYQN